MASGKDRSPQAGGLFALNATASASLQVLGGRVPVLIVEDVFQDPAAIRSYALGLHFQPPPYPYPGRIAEPPASDESLQFFLQSVLGLLNGNYLPRIPPIAANGRPITRFSRVQADFAVTDVPPDELSEIQRKPHVDPVPIFGLVYLNPEDRGGTLFFDRPAGVPDEPGRRGYTSSEDPDYPFLGRIEGKFNRLAIYPGFVLHSGEIAGDWIDSDERFDAPRLTQRLVFFP